MSKPKVAVIGTGGTIASIGKTPLDIYDYGANKTMIEVDEILKLFPEVNDVAEVVPVPYRAIPSPSVGFAEWKELVLKIDELAADPDLDGIVITHGTASLEETAYMLHLTMKADLPVVVIGSQRPSSALSTDAGFNLVNGIKVAGHPEARGMGVMTLLNDEIQCAREVTKTSTFRMQTFQSPDFGCLGHADGDGVNFYRRPLRRHAPDTAFDLRTLDALPRVDIVYAYAGGDGVAAEAFVKAGAQGLISAGFAPGFCGPEAEDVFKQAVKDGVTVIQSTRAGSGRVAKTSRSVESGILPGDNLNPQKARILLALALTVTKDPEEISAIFKTY
jgi:L-asparaginase